MEGVSNIAVPGVVHRKDMDAIGYGSYMRSFLGPARNYDAESLASPHFP